MLLLSRMNALALMATKRSDVVIATFMILAITMLIIPLPTWLVDTLIGINIGLSLLVLMVAFYISHPTDFSSLPPIILLTTLFRLALSITTTRLILLHGDAGQIVSAFGDFVIAGQLVIGLVIFLIITIAQFLVITKGAERVAEVAARFVLDAMPGKQMSIDNDLRSGDINAQQARDKRSQLERESQLYGSMDGAMKFVKGDAIAALIILCINLIGGLLIGMLQRGMSFEDALHTYSLLTAGDGLIAQIPALLIAVGAGTVVTRVSSDRKGDLGSEIIGQLGADYRALTLTAIILFFAAFIPGFATLVFLALSVSLAGAGLWVRSKHKNSMADGKISETHENNVPLENEETPVDGNVLDEQSLSQSEQINQRIVVALGGGIADYIPLEKLKERLESVRQTVSKTLGMDIPSIGWRLEPTHAPNAICIEIDEVPVQHEELPVGMVLLRGNPADLEILGIEYVVDGEMPPGRHTKHWIADESLEKLEKAGIDYSKAEDIIAGYLEKGLFRYVGDFMGIQETRVLLNDIEKTYPELINEAVRIVPLQKMADVLRRLVKESVSIRPLRTILEVFAETDNREKSTQELTERVRVALARRISFQYAQSNGLIPAMTVTRSLEEVLRRVISRGNKKNFSAMPDSLAHGLREQMRKEISKIDTSIFPTVIVSSDLRVALSQWCRDSGIEISVLSWQEISTEFSLQSIATLTLPKHDEASRNNGQKAT